MSGTGANVGAAIRRFAATGCRLSGRFQTVATLTQFGADVADWGQVNVYVEFLYGEANLFDWPDCLSS